MIDFHIHILPAMDDGSADVDTSVAMLERSAAYGVDVVAATSHFYAEDNAPKEFLRRRALAYEQLQQAVGGRTDLPRVILGAEVRFFSGISAVDHLETLCLGDTNLLLLEMPFVPWTDRMLREVEAIARRGICPVAAHVERYMDFQPRKTMAQFLDMDILVQTNASFFLGRRTAHKALKMLEDQKIQFLGSDAHNMTSRAPDLGGALEVIRRKQGQESLDYLQSFEELVTEERGAFL
jgi:protein-tyrosine phosphatase